MKQIPALEKTVINLDGTATEVVGSDESATDSQHSDPSNSLPSSENDSSENSTVHGKHFRKRTLKLANKLQERIKKEIKSGPSKIQSNRQSWEDNAELVTIVQSMQRRYKQSYQHCAIPSCMMKGKRQIPGMKCKCRKKQLHECQWPKECHWCTQVLKQDPSKCFNLSLVNQTTTQFFS